MAALVFEKQRKRIGLGIMGQSNERGNVLQSEQTTYPLAFGSQKVSGRQVPIGPAKARNGGWWHYVHDAMWDRGYDLQMVNGAIGSLSFLSQGSVIAKTWAANTSYFAARASDGHDMGDFGDVIAVNSAAQFFRCIVGNERSAFSNGGRPDGSQANGNTDYIQTKGALVSGGSAPNWAGVAAATTLTDGGTITDGGLTWQRLPNSWYNNRLGGSLQYAYHRGMGFDPLGVLDRLLEEMKRLRDVERKIVYIANAQSDLGNGASAYSNTLIAMAETFLQHNIEVMLGLSCWGGNASNSLPANYDTLTTGLGTALTTLKASWPGMVWDGANLYSLMGRTGPMGARTFNGSVTSGVLTDDGTINWGGSFEVGMKIYDSSGVYYGQIASFGTGSGGAGTYNLTGGVNVASKNLRAVGAFLNGIDAVHLTGAGAVGPDVNGVSCAGKHVSDALSAILADRRPLIVDVNGIAVP